VYTWGKGDNYRLGHGTEEHVRFPKLLESLDATIAEDDAVVDLSVGQSHVVAVTRAGRLYGWGRNDQLQLGSQLSSVVPTPTRLIASATDDTSYTSSAIMGSASRTPPGGGYVGVACGPKTTVAWPGLDEKGCLLPLSVPFVMEARSGETFLLLDNLLADIWAGLDGGGGGGRGHWPPRQEEECLACAALNLLRLQLLAVRQHGVPVASIGLGPASPLLASLKQKVPVNIERDSPTR
jgi:E3 ubiquitin-protein ligase HERC2